MNVLILLEACGWGGTQVHTIALANTLAGLGHAVNVLVLDHGTKREVPKDQAGQVTFSHLALPGPLRELGFVTWRRLLGRFAADVALFPKGSVNSGSLALDLAARWRFRRYLTIEHLIGPPLDPFVRGSHCHGLIPGLGLWWYRKWLPYHLRSLGPRKVICVSEAVRSRLTGMYGFPARKVLTVRNGIDTYRFRPDARARAAMRQQWGIAANALVCGVVGRLAPEKGSEVALEAFRDLAAHAPPRSIQLVFVGDGPMATDLHQSAKGGGWQNDVVFAGRTDRPWEAYAAIDVLLMPSRVEGLPLALLEAMACGCCPVAMAVGGIPEVITEPRLGWLVAAGDKAAFLATLREAAAAGPAALRAMGQSSRSHIDAHFQAQVQYPALAAVVEREGSRLTPVLLAGRPHRLVSASRTARGTKPIELRREAV